MRIISRHNQMFTVFLVVSEGLRSFKSKQQKPQCGNSKSHLKVQYVIIFA